MPRLLSIYASKGQIYLNPICCFTLCTAAAHLQVALQNTSTVAPLFFLFFFLWLDSFDVKGSLQITITNNLYSNDPDCGVFVCLWAYFHIHYVVQKPGEENVQWDLFFLKLRHDKIAYKVNLILLKLAFWPGNQALCIASSLIIRLSFCLQHASKQEGSLCQTAEAEKKKKQW